MTLTHLIKAYTPLSVWCGADDFEVAVARGNITCHDCKWSYELYMWDLGPYEQEPRDDN